MTRVVDPQELVGVGCDEAIPLAAPINSPLERRRTSTKGQCLDPRLLELRKVLRCKGGRVSEPFVNKRYLVAPLMRKRELTQHVHHRRFVNQPNRTVGVGGLRLGRKAVAAAKNS